MTRRAEQSAATNALLVDATIAAIADVGYAGATTEEICRRAGVTQGALFHHFATRRELLTAAIARLDEVVRASYWQAIAEFDAQPGDVTLVDLIERLQAGVRAPSNLVWLELLVEARTDPALLADISTRLTTQWSMGRSLLAAHPTLAGLRAETLEVWFDVLEDYLAGATIWALAREPDGTHSVPFDDPTDRRQPTDFVQAQTLARLAAAIERWWDG